MNLIASDAKFCNPTTTAEGKARATVAVTKLRTLWLNTGTLCNLTCENCYIESSPSNDRLAYLTGFVSLTLCGATRHASRGLLSGTT